MRTRILSIVGVASLLIASSQASTISNTETFSATVTAANHDFSQIAYATAPANTSVPFNSGGMESIGSSVYNPGGSFDLSMLCTPGVGGSQDIFLSLVYHDIQGALANPFLVGSGLAQPGDIEQVALEFGTPNSGYLQPGGVDPLDTGLVGPAIVNSALLFIVLEDGSRVGLGPNGNIPIDLRPFIFSGIDGLSGYIGLDFNSDIATWNEAAGPGLGFAGMEFTINASPNTAQVPELSPTLIHLLIGLTGLTGIHRLMKAKALS